MVYFSLHYWKCKVQKTKHVFDLTGEGKRSKIKILIFSANTEKVDRERRGSLFYVWPWRSGTISCVLSVDKLRISVLKELWPITSSNTRQLVLSHLPLSLQKLPLTADLYLAPRLGLCGALPLLPPLSSCHVRTTLLNLQKLE